MMVAVGQQKPLQLLLWHSSHHRVCPQMRCLRDNDNDISSNADFCLSSSLALPCTARASASPRATAAKAALCLPPSPPTRSGPCPN